MSARASSNVPVGKILNESTSTNKKMNDAQLVIGAVQCPLRADDQHPLEATDAAICLMKTRQEQHYQQATTSTNDQATSRRHCNKKIDLFVLPELAPIGYSEHTFQYYLPKTQENRKLHARIHAKLVETAMELNAYICYGTIGIIQTNRNNNDNNNNTNEQLPQNADSDDKFTIRQVVIEPTNGHTIAKYDKMFLCDYGDCAESRFFVPGKSLTSFAIDIGNTSTTTNGNDHDHDCNYYKFRLGLIICADIRNPLLAHQYVTHSNHKVDILLQPAAFSRDFSFRTWRSFCETRAVENSVYVCAINYAGTDFGETALVEPWVDNEHEPTVLMACQPSVLVGIIKQSTLAHVRNTMPYYKQLTLLRKETSAL